METCVEIISDSGYVYEAGHVITANRLISNYLDCCDDESLKDWIVRIPIADAIKFIADAWGIEYKFI